MIVLALWFLVTLLVLGFIWKIGDMILRALGLGDPWPTIWQLVMLFLALIALIRFVAGLLGANLFGGLRLG